MSFRADQCNATENGDSIRGEDSAFVMYHLESGPVALLEDGGRHAGHSVDVAALL